MSNVRVRFAPSPTGLLHIGGLRTALYNYLFARHHGGTFVLRIEDTDQKRYVEEAEKDIINSLNWAGMPFDEGPGKGGEHGPYRQSERSEHYQKYSAQLIQQEQAYYAFDTAEEIEDMRSRLQKSGNPSPKYDAITRMSMKNSLTLPSEEVKKRLESGEKFVVRLKVPRRETIRFEDEIRGFVSFESQGLDDQVLLKSDGLPTYHLANVVDDHLMNITHVIRGEEWLSSAPKHILLYQYLGWEPPKMAHLPLIMSPKGGKLSKRNADALGIPVNVHDYVDQHYEPEALINFLAFLGWSPGDDREVFTMEGLIKEFSLDRIGKGGAIFNHSKLIWYNEHFMREMPEEELLPKVREQAEEAGFRGFSDDYLKEFIRLMKERASLVTDFVTYGKYFFEGPQGYDEKTVKKAWKDGTPVLVKMFRDQIADLDDRSFKADILKQKLSAIVEEQGVGFGKIMQPVRLAVTGMGFGPDLFETLQLLGKERVVSRLDKALQVL
ncbi:MAG: glutamate--tRNA ligase [Balneolales bacterium]